MYRVHALLTEFPLLGIQGVVGYVRASLPRNVWLTDSNDELFQQLWSVSVPGKAHSVDDSQCRRGQAITGLRGRPECPRLAIRR